MATNQLKITQSNATDFARKNIVALVAESKPEAVALFKKYDVTLPDNVTDYQIYGAIYKGVKDSPSFRKDLSTILKNKVVNSPEYKSFVDEELSFANNESSFRDSVKANGFANAAGGGAVTATAQATGAKMNGQRPNSVHAAQVKQQQRSFIGEALHSLVDGIRHLWGGADGKFSAAAGDGTDPILSSANSSNYSQSTIGQIFSPSTIQNLLNSGLGLISQKLQSDATQSSEQNAIQYEAAQAQKYQSQSKALQAGATQAKATSWVLPVSIGLLVIGGIIVSAIMVKKSKARKAARAASMATA